MSVTAIVWDMGGIFTRYFTEIMLDVGAAKGWPLDRIPLGPTGIVPDPDYHRMAEGEIDEAGYLRIVLDRLNRAGIDYDPVSEPDWDGETRPKTWGAIHRIHDSHLSQGILTNDASKWMGEGWWESWEPIGLFDAVIDVATLAVRKPHPDSFLAAAAGLAVAPSACLFIDDMPVNCRGAEAVGMESHWFDITSPEHSIETLLARLGL